MNAIKEIMKERIKPLLELTYKANLLIQAAQKAGYTIHVGIGVLLQFSKDFSKGSSEIVDPEVLRDSLNLG